MFAYFPFHEKNCPNQEIKCRLNFIFFFRKKMLISIYIFLQIIINFDQLKFFRQVFFLSKVLLCHYSKSILAFYNERIFYLYLCLHSCNRLMKSNFQENQTCCVGNNFVRILKQIFHDMKNICSHQM